MAARWATRLMLALMPTLVAYCEGSMRSNLTSPDGVSNATDHTNHKTDTRLNKIPFDRQDIEPRKDWYNVDYLFESRGKSATGKSSYQQNDHEVQNGSFDLKSPHDVGEGKTAGRTLNQRKSFETTKKHWYNWTEFDDRRDFTLKHVSDSRQRSATNENRYRRSGVGDMKRDTRLQRISNRRAVGSTQYARYKPIIPDGFPHYYVPSSSIANFIMLYIIQPRQMLLLKQTRNVTGCLKHKMMRFDVFSLHHCYEFLSTEVLVPRWLMHLIGFVIVCFLVILVAVFMLLLCPCLMCWRISFRTIVQAGKLDTWSNATWAAITIFCCLSMLFALFGLITVACAGLGMGYYLKTGQFTHLHTTYEEIQAMALDAKSSKTHNHLKQTERINVR